MKKDIFDEMAKRYDSAERIEMANVIAKEVRKELQDSKNKALIDYGSGTGLVSLQLTDVVNSILLVDSSKQMLEIAENKIIYGEVNNAKVLQADFTEETPEIKTDIVFMSLVLLHVPNTKQLLEELFNILNEDGELIIVDFDKNDKVNHPKIHSGFSHKELKQTLLNIGFKSTEMKTFYHGKRIFAKQDASMFISSSIK